MSFVYLASPYTHNEPSMMEARYIQTRCAVAELLINKVSVYSPIVHCHSLAKRHNLPKDAEFWAWYNFSMLGRALEMWVLTFDGWEDSVGVQGEVDFADEHSIPIKYLSLNKIYSGDFIGPSES